MTNKESYLHRFAKELLYSQIVETGEFRGKDASGRQYIAVQGRGFVSRDPLMECPVDVDDTRANWTIDIVENAHLYDEPSMPIKDGYCQYDGIIDITGIIVHDIVLHNKGFINAAIEVVHKHYPSWEGSITTPYPTYIIKAENVLRRVDNTPVFIERVI